MKKSILLIALAAITLASCANNTTKETSVPAPATTDVCVAPASVTTATAVSTDGVATKAKPVEAVIKAAPVKTTLGQGDKK